MIFVCQEGMNCNGPLRLYLVRGGAAIRELGVSIVPLCAMHAKRRKETRMIKLACEKDLYAAYLSCLERDKNFRQQFEAGLVCRATGKHQGGVTGHYFSDGGTMNLCEGHAKGSHALMTVQYHDEVYDKRDGFYQALEQAVEPAA